MEDNGRSFLDTLKEDFSITPIESPLTEAAGTAMVVLTSLAGKTLIGSVGEIRSGLTEVFFPVVYMEQIMQDPATKSITGVQPIMGNGSQILGLISWEFVFAETLYFLRGDRSRDKGLVHEYEKAITALRASDAGIVSPGGGISTLRPVP